MRIANLPISCYILRARLLDPAFIYFYGPSYICYYIFYKIIFMTLVI